MREQREIKFVTSETKEKNAKGETCYQGQLRHNLVLNERETKEWFAAYCAEPVSLTTRYVDALSEFIAQQVAAGTRLDFGGFAVGLKMRGGFKSMNAPFDPRVHSVGVDLMPGREVKRAVKSLKPVNVTDGAKWHFSIVWQKTPYEAYNEIAADGMRVVVASGYFPAIHPESQDEGVWIENDEGVCLMRGRILTSEFAQTEFELTGPLPSGELWVVGQGRYQDVPGVIRARRRVSVI